jgi:hypothetical protein
LTEVGIIPQNPRITNKKEYIASVVKYRKQIVLDRQDAHLAKGFWGQASLSKPYLAPVNHKLSGLRKNIPLKLWGVYLVAGNTF